MKSALAFTLEAAGQNGSSIERLFQKAIDQGKREGMLHAASVCRIRGTAFRLDDHFATREKCARSIEAEADKLKG